MERIPKYESAQLVDPGEGNSPAARSCRDSNPRPFSHESGALTTELSPPPTGGCVSCLRACLGTRLLQQSYQYPNLSEGADRVGGQLRGDKEYPFRGVTKSGRVWRKVPESDARSVELLVRVTK